MYLFIFALLLIIFQYVKAKNVFEEYESKITGFENKVTNLEKSNDSLIDLNLDLKYFTINEKEDALTYFENRGYNTQELIPFIKDQLNELNLYEGDEHPLVPYPSLSGNKMLINKISIVNHRWILTDFTDGKYWGELFLTYDLTDDGQLKFKTVEYLIYPR